MNWLQLIERRVSVRHYLPDTEEATLAQVRRICEHAPVVNSSPLSHHLVPGIEVQKGFRGWGGKVNAPWYIAIVGTDDSEYLYNVGYSSQHLVLQLTALGLGTCWLGSLFDGEALGSSLGLGKGLAVKALIAWGRTGKERSGITTGRRLAPEKLSFITRDQAIEYPWRTVLEAVRWAPSAFNRQPWRLWFEANAIHLFSRPGIIPRFFTPMEMGIALCHLELACEQLAIPGQIARMGPPHRKRWEYWVSFSIN